MTDNSVPLQGESVLRDDVFHRTRALLRLIERQGRDWTVLMLGKRILMMGTYDERCRGDAKDAVPWNKRNEEVNILVTIGNSFENWYYEFLRRFIFEKLMNFGFPSRKLRSGFFYPFRLAVFWTVILIFVPSIGQETFILNWTHFFMFLQRRYDAFRFKNTSTENKYIGETIFVKRSRNPSENSLYKNIERPLTSSDISLWIKGKSSHEINSKQNQVAKFAPSRNSSSAIETRERRKQCRPPENLHLCFANAAQGDIVVTMKPPPSSSPLPSIHAPTQWCHVRVSHSNFCLEPDARNFANSDHAYIGGHGKKFYQPFFCTIPSPPLPPHRSPSLTPLPELFLPREHWNPFETRQPRSNLRRWKNLDADHRALAAQLFNSGLGMKVVFGIRLWNDRAMFVLDCR